MRIEEKEAVVRRYYPEWFASFMVLIVGGLVALTAFYNKGPYKESAACVLIVVGTALSWIIVFINRSFLLHGVRQWHKDEEETKDKLERAAADYLVIFLISSADDQENPVCSSWHRSWEMEGLSYLAKQVLATAENQRVVQQNPKATREEEDGAKQRYDATAQKFYSTRDTLVERGSEYAKSIERWRNALQ